VHANSSCFNKTFYQEKKIALIVKSEEQTNHTFFSTFKLFITKRQLQAERDEDTLDKLARANGYVGKGMFCERMTVMC